MRVVQPERLLIRLDRPVKYARFFKHISQINIRIQKVAIQFDGFIEIMNRQPNVAPLVINATQIWECDRKLGIALDGLQVTFLENTARIVEKRPQ